jgi:centrosomal protein CEP41
MSFNTLKSIIYDKRTIAERFGIKQKYILKENPRYKYIGPTIDTGAIKKESDFKSKSLISKRKGELFKRINCHMLYNILKERIEKNLNSQSNRSGENIEKNILNFDLDNYEFYNIIQKIDFLMLDLREPKEFYNYHIIEAQNFMAGNVNRDKFTPELMMLKTEEEKMILVYAQDEKSGIDCAQNLCKKGFMNIYYLNGGIDEFCKHYPKYLEGPEAEKFIELKKERDRIKLLTKSHSRVYSYRTNKSLSAIKSESNITGNSKKTYSKNNYNKFKGHNRVNHSFSMLNLNYY